MGSNYISILAITISFGVLGFVLFYDVDPKPTEITDKVPVITPDDDYYRKQAIMEKENREFRTFLEHECAQIPDSTARVKCLERAKWTILNYEARPWP